MVKRVETKRETNVNRNVWMSKADEDGANERASAEMRERMLQLWRWMGQEKEADVRMAADVRVRAKVRAVDATRQQVLVVELDTPIGTVPNAILRGSDVVSIRVQGTPYA